jgi:hypothetical protein
LFDGLDFPNQIEDANLQAVLGVVNLEKVAEGHELLLRFVFWVEFAFEL